MTKVVCAIVLSVLSCIHLLPQFAWGQVGDDLAIVSLEGASKAESAAEALRETTDWATATAARKQILEILGEKRFQQNKAAVESKLIRKSARFTPFVNPGTPVPQTDGSWKVPVEVKISLPSLRKMMLEAGFLADSQGPASILPLFEIVNSDSGGASRWWLGDEKSDSTGVLKQLSDRFHELLQAEFSKQGFHFIKPMPLSFSSLPHPFRSAAFSSSDLVFLTDYYRAPMVMRGEVRLTPASSRTESDRLMIKLRIDQVATGRSVAEVSRTLRATAGPFEVWLRSQLDADLLEVSRDLASQVLEAWQRGTLHANIVRLVVRGDLGPKDHALVKEGILRSVKEVKEIKERLFEPRRLAFEVEYTGELTALIARMKEVQVPGYSVQLTSSSSREVLLDVSAK